MLWYKSWLDTRWRFLIGLALLMLSAVGVVFDYPRHRSAPAARADDRRRRPARPADQGRAGGAAHVPRLRLVRNGSAQNLPHLLDAVCGAARQRRAVSLTRRQRRAVHALAAGRAAALARRPGGDRRSPSCSRSPSSPRCSFRCSRPASDRATPSAACSSTAPACSSAGAAFFSLAFLLSTVFNDLWRPLLIACGAAIALALGEFLTPGASNVGIFGVMTGESYFRTGAIPWAGLAVSVAASAAMLYGADVNIAHHDF